MAVCQPLSTRPLLAGVDRIYGDLFIARPIDTRALAFEEYEDVFMVDSEAGLPPRAWLAVPRIDDRAPRTSSLDYASTLRPSRTWSGWLESYDGCR